MFIDKSRITIKAGNGGAGAVAFHREKFVASGGPDGGDGGKGGDVLFVADTNLSTLADFRYKRKFSAASGEPGKGGNKNGRKGEDLIIRVPKGTVVREVESGAVLADLSGDEPVVCARGGRGGWGNRHFATPTRQAPRFAKDGAPGEEWEVTLELKLLADVGLVGFPNVGKSTLISVVSEAKPNIANYHFTTLSPVLGVVRMGPESSFVMADIPGLIAGAGEGAGLGHEFLRHIQRTRMLIHVVDVSGSEGRSPYDDFEIINRELATYDESLTHLPMIVAGNKIDMASDEDREGFKKYIEDKGYRYFEICAPILEGTQELINATAAMLATLPPVKQYEREEIPAEIIARKRDSGFKVTVQGDVYIVEAAWLAKILSRTDPDDYESLQYFQRTLVNSGIIDELVRRGIRPGDTVSIYDMEFEYVP